MAKTSASIWTTDEKSTPIKKDKRERENTEKGGETPSRKLTIHDMYILQQDIEHDLEKEKQGLDRTRGLNPNRFSSPV